MREETEVTTNSAHRSRRLALGAAVVLLLAASTITLAARRWMYGAHRIQAAELLARYCRTLDEGTPVDVPRSWDELWVHLKPDEPGCPAPCADLESWVVVDWSELRVRLDAAASPRARERAIDFSLLSPARSFVFLVD